MPLSDWRVDEIGSQNHCPFFRIPPELRNRIYEDLLYIPTESKCIAIVHERETTGSPSVLRLLLTCKQIRDESEGIFYNLNELYFDIGAVELPNFHRFLRALTPQRRNKIRRLNLDLDTVESLASVLRLLAWLQSIQHITFGFPRGHDCGQRGLLMHKLGKDAGVIKAAIQSMTALQQIKVAVVGNARRRQDPLALTEAQTMQTCLQSLVEKNVGPEASLEIEPSGPVRAVTVTKDLYTVYDHQGAGPLAECLPAAEWPARRFSNYYNRFECPDIWSIL